MVFFNSSTPTLKTSLIHLEFYLQEHQKPSSSATKARAPYVYNRLSARTKLHPPDQKSRRVDTGCCDPKTPSIRSVVVADSAHVEAPPTSLPNSPPPPWMAVNCGYVPGRRGRRRPRRLITSQFRTRLRLDEPAEMRCAKRKYLLRVSLD